MIADTSIAIHILTFANALGTDTQAADNKAWIFMVVCLVVLLFCYQLLFE